MRCGVGYVPGRPKADMLFSGLAIERLRPLKLHRSKAFGCPKPMPYFAICG